MRALFSVSASLLLTTALGGCAVMHQPEVAALKCGETKTAKYSIPTRKQPVLIDVDFKRSCEADKNGVESSLKGHPWGGVGKTMPMSVGAHAPHYEYIPCGDTKADQVELKKKWDDFENYEHYADKGRDIEDIRDVQIDMRFREDYALRHYMLNSAKNLCSATPQ